MRSQNKKPRTWKTWIGYTLLFMGVLLLGLPCIGLMIAQSKFGQEKIKALVELELQTNLEGSIRIGKLETDIFSRVRLQEISFKSSEGNFFAKVKEVNLTYNIWALYSRKFHIYHLQFENVELMGFLDEKGAKLPKLLRTHSPSLTKVASSPAMIVQVDQFSLHGSTRFLFEKQPQPTGVPLVPVQVQMKAEGAFLLASDWVDVSQVKVSLHAVPPYDFDGELTGGYRIQNGTTVIPFSKLTARFPLSQAAFLLPQPSLNPLSLQGDASLVGYFYSSSSKDLQFYGGIHTRAGELKIAGEWDLALALLKMSVTGGKLNLEQLSKKLPPGNFHIGLEFQGTQAGGQIKAKQLSWESSLGTASLQGELVADFGRAPKFSLKADVQAPDLRKISAHPWFAMYLPLSSGTLSSHVEIQQEKNNLSVKGEFLGQTLKFKEVSVRKLVLRGNLDQGNFQLRGEGTDVELKNVRLRAITVTGEGNSKEGSFQVQGKGHGARFDLAFQGAPLFHQGYPSGLEGTLSRFSMQRHYQSWSLQEKTTLRINVQVPMSIELKPTLLSSGRQKIYLEGIYEESEQKVIANLKADHLNLQKIARFIYGTAPVPATNLALQAKVEGSLDRLKGEVSLQGRAHAFSRLGWKNARYQLKARYTDGHLQGMAKVVSPRSYLKVNYRIPLSERKRLWAELTGQVPLELARVFLPAMKHLEGRVSLRGVLSGTPLKPELQMEATTGQFQAGVIKGRGAKFVVDYRRSLWKVDFESGVRAEDGVVLGHLGFTSSFTLPIHKLFGSVHEAHQSIVTMPLQFDLSLNDIAINEWLRSLFPNQFFPAEGFCTGTLRGEGPLREPTIALDLKMSHVGIKQVGGVFGNLSFQANYQKREADFSLQADLQNQPLLKAQGSLSFPLQGSWVDKIVTPLFWEQSLVNLTVHAIPYRLASLSTEERRLSGLLSGQMEIQGPLSKPRGEGMFTLEEGAFQGWQFPKIQVNAYYKANQLVEVSTKIFGRSGSASINIELPIPLQREKFTVSLFANQFVIDFEPRVAPKRGPRVLKGIFDAELHMSWPDRKLQIEGILKGKEAQLGLRTDPRLYRNINFDLELQSTEDQTTRVKLKNLTANAEVGKIQASGSGILKELSLMEAQLKLQTENFPISEGALGIWLNTKATLIAKTQKGILMTDLTLEEGSARLPKLSSSRELQSLEQPGELVYVDQIAQKEQALEEEQTLQEESQLPTKANILIHIPGPFQLKGPEIGAKIEGQLAIEVKSKGPSKMTGYLRSLEGWVKIFDKQYQLQKARLAFEENSGQGPLVDFQLSRRLADATMYVEMTGTFDKPVTTVRTDPPIYNSAQVLALLWGGDPKNPRSYPSAEQQQGALGLFSGLVSGQLKKRLGVIAFWDTLKVDSTAGKNPTDFNQTRVEIGKYLRNNLYIGYAYQFGVSVTGTKRQNPNEVRVEWRALQNVEKLPKKVQFLRNLELNTSYGDANVGTFDVFLHWRF